MTNGNLTEQAGTQGVATPQVQTPAQPASPNGAAQEQAQEQTPQYVTVEHLAQFGEQIVTRMKQSDKDRSKRIEGEITQIKARLESTGVTLAPEQEIKLRNRIGEEIDSPAVETQTPQAQASPEGDADKIVAQFVSDIFLEAGTQVTKTDPEWGELQKVLDATWNDPKGAIKVTRAALKAAEAKALRLSSNNENAAARVVGAGGSTATNTQAVKSAHDAWSQAYKS